MKKLLFAVAAAALMALSINASAQGKYGADSAECIKYLSYYKEYFKQKNYTQATPNWRQAFQYCPPTANQTMLVDGATLMRQLIKANAKNPVYKNALIDSLMMLHDLRVEYYPKYAVTARNNKGLDLASYVKDDNQRLFDSYNEIIEANKNQTKANIFLFDLNAAIELYKVGVLDEEAVLGVYERNSDLIAKCEAKNDSEKEQNDKARADMEALFVSSKIASCDKIIALFEPQYNAAPEDVALSTKIVKLMSASDDCIDNDLFLKAATTVYKNNPSHNAAHTLYLLNSKTGKVDKAISFLEEAIAMPESDDEVDANYYYELAVYAYKSNRNSQSVVAAKKSISLTASSELKAKNYMLMGNIWAATKVSGNEIESRANFWVAVDNYEMAKKFDASLTDDANKAIAQCKQYYPLAADAFMYGVEEGHSYQVNAGAGLSAVTTVRTQK